MKVFNIFFLTAVLTVFVSGCASSDRMMRVSPLREETAFPLKNGNFNYDESRINTWPLLYMVNDKTSILWPMADIDKRGWAIRPLFNKEGQEYSVLFPLCAWNPEKVEGWVFTAYWNSRTTGFLPFFYHRKNAYTYLFPAAWNDKYFLVLPLSYYSKDFAYFGPLWWNFGKVTEDEPDEPINNSYGFASFWMNYKSGLLNSGGFWPLFLASGEKSWFFPLYLYKNDENFLLTPLSYYSKDFAYFGPLWWNFGKVTEDEPDEPINNSYGFASFWMNYNSGSLDSGGFWPLFLASGEKNWFFPLYLYMNDNNSKLLLTLLAGTNFDKTKNEYSMISLLGPLFIYDNDENSQIWTFLFPFTYFENSKKEKDDIFFIFPYYQRQEENKYFNFLLPFYSYKEAPAVREILFPFLLSAYSKTEKSSDYDVLFPLFHLKETKEDNNEFSFWPLFSYHDRFSFLNLNEDGFSILGPLVFRYRGDSHKHGTCTSPIRSAFDSCCGNSDKIFYSSSYNLLLLNFFKENKNEKWPLRNNDTFYSAGSFLFLFWFSSHTTRNININDELVKSDIEEVLNIISNDMLAGADIKISKNKNIDMAKEKARLAEILKKYDCYKGTSDKELGEGVYLMDWKLTTETNSSKYSVPLLFKHKNEGNKSEGNILFYLSRWKSEGDKSRFSILEYFYRYESDGKNSSNDIFPFISYDSGEDLFKLSFMWRFLSYKKENKKTEFHLFFIPIF